jgi:hypothetical protein
MKMLVQMSIFITILYGVMQLPNLAPKQPLNLPVVKAEVTVEPIDARPAEQSSPIVTKSNDIEQMIKDTFGKDGDRAVKIAFCESGLDPSRVREHDPVVPSVGLFQINLTADRGLTVAEMQDAQNNINYAKIIFDKRGWDKDWVTCAKKTR